MRQLGIISCIFGTLLLVSCGPDLSTPEGVREAVLQGEDMASTVQVGGKNVQAAYVPPALSAMESGASEEEHSGIITLRISIPKTDHDAPLPEGSIACGATLRLADGRELSCIDALHEASAPTQTHTVLLLFHRPAGGLPTATAATLVYLQPELLSNPAEFHLQLIDNIAHIQ